ncbi:restriction endonuclease subunit S [Vibrio vulnificus]|uniref:restriction endonuclease subunit S n=1 Tax=Vibrio vulnificus TaxID=672 RepID=UPI0019D48CE6|nr:restriction endonuclease subunit S [Vibrio vulnificus]MBN8033031.1 restriction endonuclease subunit S [Vibrio vulnificus]
MSSEWFKGTWGDLVELKYGKGLKNYKESNEEIPVFGTNGPVGFTSKALCDFPSIIIGRKGAYRGVHFSSVPFWVIDTAYFVVPKKDFNIKWAYYHLLTQDINALDSGSAIPSTSREDFYQLPVNMPPRWIQDEIVNNLDVLNKKINLNSKSSQTLEEMAQAIFKSWFVDFDPVKAKINGEQPEGMDAATASLFPDKLVESELGLIPEGWEVKNVGEFTDTFDYVANGSFAALKANVELFDEPNDVLYVRTTDFNKGFKNDLKYTNESSYQFLSKSKLYGHETIISNVGDVGTVFRAPSWYDMPMTLGSNAMGIVAEGANSYIYYLFKSHTGQHLLDGITSGSAQMKFNKTSFRKLRVVLPSNELLAKFEELEASLWAKHASNQKESLHLEKLRDTLLPKLLSGEIELGLNEAVELEA